MVIIINLIAALVLFWLPVKAYADGHERVVKHPFRPGVTMSINLELYFLVYSVLTAMVFIAPFSLWKYGFWILFLLALLMIGKLQIKMDVIVKFYMLFIAWSVVSTFMFSTAKFQALMMLIKYSLPLLYLWLSYTAIKDSHDLQYFMKTVTIGMCVYALIIGGFSAKVLTPLYGWLNYGSGGLFISYASLADYFSALIVVPIGVYLITRDRRWIYATAWVVLSTLLEAVRTGLGGIFLASSFFLFTIFRGKALPWIAAILFAAVVAVFTIPSLHQKMFKDENASMSTFTVSDANFENINSNAREFIWERNMQKFYDPHPLTGSGLGESVNFMKNQKGLKMIHSDYVQILCDLGLIGIVLFGLFALVAIINIISVAWSAGTPLVLKLTGGMALGSCAGTFFSMGFDNVMAYSQQSFVIPFVMIGIYLKVKDLYYSEEWH